MFCPCHYMHPPRMLAMTSFRGVFRFVFVKGPKETNVTTALKTLSALAPARQRSCGSGRHEMKAQVPEACGNTKRNFLFTVRHLLPIAIVNRHPTHARLSSGWAGKRISMQNACISKILFFSVHIWIRCATEPLRIDGYRTRLHRTVHASADKQAI